MRRSLAPFLLLLYPYSERPYNNTRLPALDSIYWTAININQFSPCPYITNITNNKNNKTLFESWYDVSIDKMYKQDNVDTGGV